MWLPNDSPPYVFPPNLEINPMSPTLRRALLNIAKQAECSDDTLHVILGADVVALLDVPAGAEELGGLVAGALYRIVADAVVRRFFDCARLFADFPSPFKQSIWFACRRTPRSVDLDTLEPTNPLQCLLPEESAWDPLTPEKFAASNGALQTKCLAEITAMEFKAVAGDSAQLGRLVATKMITVIFQGMAKRWQKLSEVCQIKLLNEAYSDRRKRRTYEAAGTSTTERRAEEHMQLLADDAGMSPESPRQKIPKELSTKWFIEGFCDAYWREVEELDQGLYGQRSQLRFARAFQIFSDSLARPNPHRFVGLVTCLEGLLSSSSAELGYQLASRVAWLLAKQDDEARVRMFARVKDLYGLRSKVVHGEPYSVKTLSEDTEDLLDVVRRVLIHILSDPDAQGPFFTNPKAAGDYLKRLSLGATS